MQGGLITVLRDMLVYDRDKGVYHLHISTAGPNMHERARVWAFMCFPSGSMERDQQVTVLER
jgi:hypothetical protein